MQVGNRTIMMYEGRIILDIQGKVREEMTVPGLIDLFHQVSGEKLQGDRMLLT